MAPHSSTLAWKIPWTEEPGRLQSMGSRRVDTTEWLDFHFYALEKEMATHSSVLAWRIPGTERLHFHFSLSCIGEGNGNPLQCSCLEYPRDGGAWWAAVYGVAQSQTRLKWLSSSSSSKRGKSGWETMKTEGEISENCRLHCEWFLTWKHQWCLKIVLKVSANC